MDLSFLAGLGAALQTGPQAYRQNEALRQEKQLRALQALTAQSQLYDAGVRTPDQMHPVGVLPGAADFDPSAAAQVAAPGAGIMAGQGPSAMGGITNSKGVTAAPSLPGGGMGSTPAIDALSAPHGPQSAAFKMPDQELTAPVSGSTKPVAMSAAMRYAPMGGGYAKDTLDNPTAIKMREMQQAAQYNALLKQSLEDRKDSRNDANNTAKSDRQDSALGYIDDNGKFVAGAKTANQQQQEDARQKVADLQARTGLTEAEMRLQGMRDARNQTLSKFQAAQFVSGTKDLTNTVQGYQQAKEAIAQARLGNPVANKAAITNFIQGAEAKGGLKMGMLNYLKNIDPSLAGRANAMWDQAVHGTLPAGQLDMMEKMLDGLHAARSQEYEHRLSGLRSRNEFAAGIVPQTQDIFDVAPPPSAPAASGAATAGDHLPGNPYAPKKQ